MMSHMRTLSACAVRYLRAVMVTGVFVGSTVNAQTKDSAAVKYGFAVGSPVWGLPIPGAGIALGHATWQASKRFDVRSELTIAHLPNLQSENVSYAPCPAGSICTSSPKKPIGLAGITEQLILNDDYIARGDGKGSYFVLGGGMYRQVSPSAVGSIGGAVEGGLGFKFGGASFEAKVVYIRHWIGGDSGMIPVTVGYTW